jgi:polygalacturonase
MVEVWPDFQLSCLTIGMQVAHGLFSMGMAGQGRGHPNRFIVFRGNSFVGGNGMAVWGIGNSDVLVENNHFNSTNISIALDHFPTNVSAVTNVVIRNNTES